MHVRCRQAIVTAQNGVLEVVKSGNGNNFAQYLAYAATPSWRGGHARYGSLADMATRQMSAYPPKADIRRHHRASLTQAPRKLVVNIRPGMQKKSPRNTPGFKTLKLNWSSLRELAKCLSGTRLEGLRGRKRNFLSKHCEFLGLLGQRFELLA